jgi:hypothetical protein
MACSTEMPVYNSKACKCLIPEASVLLHPTVHVCVYVLSFGLVRSPPVMVCAPEGMCVLSLCFRLLPERTDISVPFVFWHATSSDLVVFYYNMLHTYHSM